MKRFTAALLASLVSLSASAYTIEYWGHQSSLALGDQTLLPMQMRILDDDGQPAAGIAYGFIAGSGCGIYPGGNTGSGGVTDEYGIARSAPMIATGVSPACEVKFGANFVTGVVSIYTFIYDPADVVLVATPAAVDWFTNRSFVMSVQPYVGNVPVWPTRLTAVATTGPNGAVGVDRRLHHAPHGRPHQARPADERQAGALGSARHIPLEDARHPGGAAQAAVNDSGALASIFEALQFAAHKHRDQRRKDPDASPYINHPIALANILWVIGGIHDPDVICAALLHDTVEDTETTVGRAVAHFGPRSPRSCWKSRRHKDLESPSAISCRSTTAPQPLARGEAGEAGGQDRQYLDVASSPPANWPLERRREYFHWAKRVVDGLRGVDPKLEALFDEAYQRRP